jgi:erythromycin esterase-like protein
VANAEGYYRAMFADDASAWNLRDQHMADVLVSLTAHLQREQSRAKVVVWAHNSHVGDARATEMALDGQLNLGQLARERLGTDAVLVGFTTYSGSVTAASRWDEPARHMSVRPALPGSVEALFHDIGVRNFALDLSHESVAASALRAPRLHRAIGVIYRPSTERQSHYLLTSLSEQFDLVLHYDATRAVEPMDRGAAWRGGEVPETYPVAV